VDFDSSDSQNPRKKRKINESEAVASENDGVKDTAPKSTQVVPSNQVFFYFVLSLFIELFFFFFGLVVG